jgi:hypothetical protein
MNLISKCAVSTAVLLGAVSLPALAGSLSTSSAAGGSSASSASSASVNKSSDSSSTNKTTAEGPYRIIDVAAVPGRSGTVRVKLQALADTSAGGELVVYMPQQALDRSQLGAGQTVTARQRPYGMEFAVTETQKAFFLVVDDDWYRELASNPVVL